MDESSPTNVIRQDIFNNNVMLKDLIVDIKECPGPLDVLNELNADGRSKIATIRKLINDLDKIGKEQHKLSDQFEVLQEVASHRQQLACTVDDFRKANVTCFDTIQKNELKEDLTEGDEEESLLRHWLCKDKDEVTCFDTIQKNELKEDLSKGGEEESSLRHWQCKYKDEVTCSDAIQKKELKEDLSEGDEKESTRKRQSRNEKESLMIKSIATDREFQQWHRTFREGFVEVTTNETLQLLSTSQNLADKTQRIADTLETLANSSTTIDGTQEELHSTGSVIPQSSKQQLVAVWYSDRTELTNKVLLFSAFALGLACMIYIVSNTLCSDL